LLGDAGSDYRVRGVEEGGYTGLERIVDATVTKAARRAGKDAGAAGRTAAKERLRSAWCKACGLHPDPGGAYADAVRAVEDVACPIFLPTSPEPTLGAVRSHLEQGGHKYELVIADGTAVPANVDVLTSMVVTLWFGYRDRHEGGPTSAAITVEAARAAAYLAAALVRWLSSGAVRRKL
jgi:hypothetical protein